mmetsp:Transcript_15150/g.41021  ORF Transcript_15150/g.41021 Transcript_15150/m.41021 type:complete len:329 (+) Transcript_15150:147-1133(+)
MEMYQQRHCNLSQHDHQKNSSAFARGDLMGVTCALLGCLCLPPLPGCCCCLAAWSCCCFCSLAGADLGVEGMPMAAKLSWALLRMLPLERAVGGVRIMGSGMGPPCSKYKLFLRLMRTALRADVAGPPAAAAALRFFPLLLFSGPLGSAAAAPLPWGVLLAPWLCCCCSMRVRLPTPGEGMGVVVASASWARRTCSAFVKDGAAASGAPEVCGAGLWAFNADLLPDFISTSSAANDLWRIAVLRASLPAAARSTPSATLSIAPVCFSADLNAGVLCCLRADLRADLGASGCSRTSCGLFKASSSPPPFCSWFLCFLPLDLNTDCCCCC